MQPSVIYSKSMKHNGNKEDGSKILWLIAISVAVLGVAVMATIFINSKEAMKKIDATEKVKESMRPTSQQRVQSQQEVQQKRDEPKYRREIRKTNGQSKEFCLKQSNGTFDNSYVKCREGDTKEVWVRID